MHLLEKKESLVTLQPSQMTISSLFCLLSLCAFGQLFNPFLFPQPDISCTMPHYCRILCSSTMFATAPAALWEETKQDAELSRLLLNVAWEERRKEVSYSIPFQKGDLIRRSAWCLTRQPRFHVCLETYLAGGRQDIWWSDSYRSERVRLLFPIWL